MYVLDMILAGFARIGVHRREVTAGYLLGLCEVLDIPAGSPAG
jgi:hypothetical protein